MSGMIQRLETVRPTVECEGSDWNLRKEVRAIYNMEIVAHRVAMRIADADRRLQEMERAISIRKDRLRRLRAVMEG